MSSFQYRPEIDGLRAVAVAAVILFHAGLKTLAGGFVGVDVFFVISGYLITTIILRERTEGQFSMLRFWERRARRILPALYVVMLACIPFAALLMLPDQHLEFSRSLVAVGLFFSNILFWHESGYFAAVAEEKPLLHTWSLSVEEQFYILFPLLLALLWRFRGRGLAPMLGVIALLSLALSEYAAQALPTANFFLLPTRAWELLAGALCALWLFDRDRPGHGGLAILGLSILVISIFWFDATTPFPSLWAVIPVAGSALVILFARSGNAVGRMLSLRAVVGMGLISYSAYLWHQPMLAFARIAYIGQPPLWLMLALAAASLPIAVLSWRFVEQPFRSRGGAFARPRQLAVVLVPALAVLLAVGVHGHLNQGYGGAWMATARPDQVTAFRLMQETRRSRPIQNTSGCVFDHQQITPSMIAEFSRCAQIYGPGVAILGDSHGNELFQMASETGSISFLANFSEGRCRPYSKTNCPYANFLQMVKDEPSLFSTAFYSQAGWQFLVDDYGKSGRDVFVRYRPGQELEPETISVRQDYIDLNARYLDSLSRHLAVVWVTPKIEPMIDADAMVRMGCAASFSLRGGQDSLYREIEASIRKTTAKTGIQTVSAIDALAFDMQTDFADCTALFWRDWDHLSVAGRERMRERLVPALLPFLTKPGRGEQDPVVMKK